MMNETLEAWLRAVDGARGNRGALQALLTQAQQADGPEARSAAIRAQRLLKELDSSSACNDSTPEGRRLSPELSASIIADLEADDGFLLDEASIPSLLRHANDLACVRAFEILSTLSHFKAFSAKSLLLKAGLRGLDSMPTSAREWIWAYALKTRDHQVLDAFEEAHVIFPRRLLEIANQIEATPVRPASSGFIYLLRELGAQPCTLKIGMTTKSVEERVAELNSSTSQHRQLALLMDWRVDNARDAERAVHEALGDFRVRAGREFFQLEPNEAIAIINRLLLL